VPSPRVRIRARASGRAVAMVALCAAAAAARAAPAPDDIQQFLATFPEDFGTVLAAPARYRVQVLHTRVDRRGRGAPVLTTRAWRADADSYVYPASTVKLPVAALALEWLRDRNDPRLRSTTAMEPPSGLAAAATGLLGTADASKLPGVPSVATYVRHIGLVSNNFAYNRLYDLLGADAINGALRDKGYGRYGSKGNPLRIVHRVADAAGDDPALSPPLRFADEDGMVLQRPARAGGERWYAPEPIPLGRAEIVDGARIDAPKDFASKNALPLRALHAMLIALVLPESVPPAQRFRLRAEDRQLLLDALTRLPSEAGFTHLHSAAGIDDGYVKYLVAGGAGALPPGVHITNKVGQAYGFLTDSAYITEPAKGVEFFLSATIYVNDNGTFNDGVYEYDAVGLPFLKALGLRFLEAARESAP
jgi:hypothetical protein